HPGLAHLLGQDGFEAFARAYLTEHPPTGRLLRDLGAHLVAFAERHAAVPAELREACIDMLRYEETFLGLADGAEPPPLAPDALASIPHEAWDLARIALHPLLRPMRFSSPVHRIRLAATTGGKAPQTAGPVHLALFRKDFVICFEELEPAAYELLVALGEGEPL